MHFAPAQQDGRSYAELVAMGFVEIEPLTYISGRSLPNVYMIVNGRPPSVKRARPPRWQACDDAMMKLLITLFMVGFLGGCLVEERRECSRGGRWDGHHCMVEHDRGHDHDGDHDRGHDGDHDRGHGHDHDGDNGHDNGHGHGHGHD